MTPGPLFLLIITILSVPITIADLLTYTYTFPENQTGFLGNLPRDLGLSQRTPPYNSRVHRFQVVQAPPGNSVGVNSTTGDITIRYAINRDVLCPSMVSCTFASSVAMVDIINHSLVDDITLTFNITAVKKNVPKFPVNVTSIQISDSVAVNYTVRNLPLAIDNDPPPFGIQGYRLVPPSNPVFRVDTYTSSAGVLSWNLVVTQKLSRQAVPRFSLVVEAYDASNTGAFMTLNIEVTYAVNNVPIFSAPNYYASIADNVPVNTVVITVTATEANGVIRYSFDSPTVTQYGNVFGIRNDTGDIYTTSTLDYDVQPLYVLVVIARDNNPDAIPQYAKVTVNITDVNELSPTVVVNTLTQQNTSAVEMTSETANNTFVAQVVATEYDKSGLSKPVTCSLNDTFFRLQTVGLTYELRTVGRLDAGRYQSYDIVIECRDYGTPPRSTVKILHVIVHDINDAPVFESPAYSVHVTENSVPTGSIMTVHATDNGIGASAIVRYSLSANVTGVLAVDSNTGAVTLLKAVNREKQPYLNCLVFASDGGTPAKTGTASLQVIVDEEPPVLPANLVFSIGEGQTPPVYVGNVTVMNYDTGDYIAYGMGANFANVFAIDVHSGVITAIATLDREATPDYDIQVTATNAASWPNVTTTTVKLIVMDSNDNRPSFIFPSNDNNTVKLSSATPIGTLVATVRATDLDDGKNAVVRYTFKGSGSTWQQFSLNNVTGDITVARVLGAIVYQEYYAIVTASDTGEPTLYTDAALNIVVDSALPVNNAPTTKRSTATPNETTVIVVACIAGSIIAVLLICIALLLLRKRESKKNAQKLAQVFMVSRQEVMDEHERNSSRSSIPKEVEDLSGSRNNVVFTMQSNDESFTNDIDSGRGGSDEGDGQPPTPIHPPFHHPPQRPPQYRQSPAQLLESSRLKLLYRDNLPKSRSVDNNIYYPDRLNISLPEGSVPLANRDAGVNPPPYPPRVARTSIGDMPWAHVPGGQHAHMTPPPDYFDGLVLHGHHSRDVLV